MKATFEIKDHVLVIDETEGSLTVTLTKDDETVEEFTAELGEGGEESTEDDYSDEGGEDEGGEELPAEDEAPEEGGDEPIEGEEEEDFSANESVKVHSFGSFLKSKNRRK